jgi:hypothetical protein
MKINLHRLAGMGFGAALAIMLSVDVDAAPLSIAQAPTQISAFDGLVTQAWVRVRRRGHRVPRQMAHRPRGQIHRERTMTHSPE